MIFPVGVIVERKEYGNGWGSVLWRPSGIVPGGPTVTQWRLLNAEGPSARYYAGRFTMRLYPGDTEAYRANLAENNPSVFIVLRRFADTDHPGDVRPVLVTAAQYEAELYLDGGEDIVEPVPMPRLLSACMEQFVELHHVEQPFIKRQRTDARPRHG